MEQAAEVEKARTVSDLIELIVKAPLEFEPGTRFGYSNSGYVVLGAIVERLSGQSYYDYVREQIFKPAGMTNTDWHEPG
jgi:D-alanyl-D-alanine carboxypeptidase